jgi:hypothetical protein
VSAFFLRIRLRPDTGVTPLNQTPARQIPLGILVDNDDLINYQLLIIYQLLIRTFTYQPTVDKTIVLSTNC